MANSLLTGVTGLRVHQQMLDVVGNNLANSNTTGFKSQRVRFSDLVYQTLNQAAASGETGGRNPLQIGLGARVTAMDANLQQGSLESTESDLDMAIQGAGFFVAHDGAQTQFTRAGAFGVDARNYLVDPATGFRIQRFGTIGEGSPTEPAFQTAGDNSIKIPIGTGIPGRDTSNIVFQGNLSASAVGPRAQTLTSSQPLLTVGVAATAATLLNDLDSNGVDYIGGDQIRLQGLTVGGAAIDVNVAVGAATTVGDLITAINANFPGSLATLDASGNLTVQANNTGPTGLNVTITDVIGNTGGSTWNNHLLTPTVVGKDGDTVTTGIQFYDTQGTAHNLSLTFQKQGSNVWDLSANMAATDGVLVDSSVQGITFNDDGSFRQVSGTGLGDGFMRVQINGLAVTQTVGFYFGQPSGFDGLTQVGGNSSAVAKEQDGFAAGFLTNISVAQNGVINGVFTNGRILPIAQLAIASFANPGALLRQGNNYYGLSSESGTALVGAGLAGGRGSVQQKTLESSNVDVALEFTRLIIAQRGFQVNARTITAGDQVLQELANIIR